MYVLDDIRPLRKLAAQKGTLNKNIIAFENNDAYKVTYKNQPGYEWSTWGVWNADNKPRGAVINFYANVKPKDTATNKIKDSTANALKKIKLDTAIVKIYNSQNELIRTINWAADTGFNKKVWRMDEKGFRRPGSAKPKPNDEEPNGDAVLPGKYKVVITFNKEADSSFITVKADPRKPDNSEIILAQKILSTQLKKTADKLTQGMDQLTDAEDITKKYEAQLKDIDTPMADSIRKQCKKMQEEIKTITEFIMGKKIERQGYGQIPQETVLTAFEEALDNINGKNAKPTNSDELLVKKAEGKITEAITKINTFFSGKWKTYQALIENNKVDLFKEFKQL
jgi:hypothetical protein